MAGSLELSVREKRNYKQATTIASEALLKACCEFFAIRKILALAADREHARKRPVSQFIASLIRGAKQHPDEEKQDPEDILLGLVQRVDAECDWSMLSDCFTLEVEFTAECVECQSYRQSFVIIRRHELDQMSRPELSQCPHQNKSKASTTVIRAPPVMVLKVNPGQHEMSPLTLGTACEPTATKCYQCEMVAVIRQEPAGWRTYRRKHGLTDEEETASRDGSVQRYLWYGIMNA